jgi:hypothetical protein
MGSQLYQKLKWWGIVWLARRLPDCKQTTRLISDSLDQKLSLRQRMQIKLHLLICVWCRRYAQQLLFMRQVMRHTAADFEESDSSPAPSLSPETRARIKRSLNLKNQ